MRFYDFGWEVRNTEQLECGHACHHYIHAHDKFSARPIEPLKTLDRTLHERRYGAMRGHIQLLNSHTQIVLVRNK